MNQMFSIWRGFCINYQTPALITDMIEARRTPRTHLLYILDIVPPECGADPDGRGVDQSDAVDEDHDFGGMKEIQAQSRDGDVEETSNLSMVSTDYLLD